MKKKTFLRLLWKNLFCQYIIKNPNWRKRCFSLNHFEKIVAWAFVQKYPHFKKIYVMLRSLKKSFFGNINKYTTIQGKGTFLKIALKKSFLDPISENFNISRIITLFFRSLFHFLIKFSRKRKFFEITLKKSFFAHISENINTSRKSKSF